MTTLHLPQPRPVEVVPACAIVDPRSWVDRYAMAAAVGISPSPVFQTGGGAAVSPPAAGNPTAWWRLDLDAYRVLSGSDITQLTDVSGNGNHAIQNGAAGIPSYEATGLNSKPSARFTASSSEYLKSNAIASLVSGSDVPFSMLWVGRTLSATAVQRPWCFGSSTDNDPRAALLHLGSSSYMAQRLDDAGANDNQTGGTTDTLWHVWSLVFTGTTVSFYVGTTAILSAASHNVGAFNVDRFAMGAFLQATPTQFWDGYISEMLFYNRALTTGASSEHENTVNELTTRWAP